MSTFLADLIELEADFLARANQARQWAEKVRVASIRHRQHGIADMAEDAAKRIREIIEQYEPRKPLLRLVADSAKESVHG